MTKHFDQMKHHRGSSLPVQEPGQESDKALNEWIKALKSIPKAAGRERSDAKGTDSSGDDIEQHGQKDGWQDEGGEGG